MATRLRTVVRRVLATTTGVAAPLTWYRRGDHLAVLMYHRVLPRDDLRYAREQPGMVVTPATLERHLWTLRRHFHVVSLAEWLEQRPRYRTPCCAITFDDGWRDNHEHAWPLLRAAGVPATVFLATDMIGTDADFWPGRLARLATEAGQQQAWSAPELSWLRALDPAAADGANRDMVAGHHDSLITAAKRLPEHELLARLEAAEKWLGLNASPPDGRVLMNWDEIREMAADGRIEFGSHTRRHRRLTQDVDHATMEDEIRGSAETLARELDRSPGLFSYPNGDTSPLAADIVARHYAGAVTTRRGWNRPFADPHAVRRIAVHDDIARSGQELKARLGGFF